MKHFFLSIGFLIKAFRHSGKGAAMGFDIPRKHPLTNEQLSELVSALTTFFPAVDPAKLKALLVRSSFPAEALLAEFLVLVNWPDIWSQLNWEYQDEFNDSELLENGLKRVAELRFDRPVGGV